MSTFLTAEWRKLIMAQYIVAPETLTPFLPAGIELDLYQGQCYVSLVGFLFDRVCVKGLAIPFHTRFEEVNLRFYVLRTAPDGTRRRGVVFIREFVPRFAITAIADRIYEEPYATLPMRHSIEQTPTILNVSYDWKHRSTWHSMAVQASSTPQPITPGSEPDFITEHYWGYTKRSNGTTSEYAVQHPRWLTYEILSSKISADFSTLYGPSFAHLDAANPSSVLLAEGSAVSVGTGARIARYA
jgi:uncharacterized protein